MFELVPNCVDRQDVRNAP